MNELMNFDIIYRDIYLLTKLKTKIVKKRLKRMPVLIDGKEIE